MEDDRHWALAQAIVVTNVGRCGNGGNDFVCIKYHCGNDVRYIWEVGKVARNSWKDFHKGPRRWGGQREKQKSPYATNAYVAFPPSLLRFSEKGEACSPSFRSPTFFSEWIFFFKRQVLQ